jgi:hypothetical protein
MNNQTQNHQRYGPWEYDADQRILYCKGYEVDVTECTTCPKTLDLIFQIADKSWADESVVYGLIMALRVILQPRTRLCAEGIERGPIDLKRAQISVAPA